MNNARKSMTALKESESDSSLNLKIHNSHNILFRKMTYVLLSHSLFTILKYLIISNIHEKKI